MLTCDDSSVSIESLRGLQEPERLPEIWCERKRAPTVESKLKPSSKTVVPKRERQVLECAAEGMTDKEIAAVLGISTETVNTYWRRIRQRFGAVNRAEVVALVTREKTADTLKLMSEENERLLFEIAQRKRAEAQALTSEMRWLSLLRHAPDIIHHCTLDGVILFTNTDSENQVAPPGTNILDLAVGPNEGNRAKLVNSMRKAAKTGKAESLELQYIFADGTVGWYLLRIGKIQGQDPPEVVIVSTRITESKLQQLALQRSDALYEEAQRIASVGNWQFDVQSGTIWWSKEVYRIFGRPTDLGPPSYEEQVAVVHPDDRDVWNESVQRSLTITDPVSFEHRAVLPDGANKYLSCRSQSTMDESGNVVSLHGTVQDITDRKAVELRLKEFASQRRGLLSVAQQFERGATLQEIVDGLEQAMRKVVDFGDFALFLFSEKSGLLEPLLVTSSGWLDRSFQGMKIRPNEGIAGSVFASGTAENVAEAHLDPRSIYPKGSKPIEEHVACVPLRSGSKAFGVVDVGRSGAAEKFQDEEFLLIQLFVEFASLAIQRLRRQ